MSTWDPFECESWQTQTEAGEILDVSYSTSVEHNSRVIAAISGGVSLYVELGAGPVLSADEVCGMARKLMAVVS